MKQTIRQITIVVLGLVLSVAVNAQVTTSSIGGRVTDVNGDVHGAVVIATHTPSGTQYHSVTDKNGNYRIVNMRVGGPYAVKISMLGYAEYVADGIVLKLGENFVYNVSLKEEKLSLDEVIITAKLDNSIMNSDKSGTSTNVSSREMSLIPVVNRTVDNVVKMSPHSNGMSFAGRDSRMNNFTVDGAGFNNNFGLSSSLPGGDPGPVSLDAIEEISVSIAPYDIRNSRFTGASINAVTKSGNNTFSGSAYTFLRGNNMIGKKVDGNEINNANSTSRQSYGVSFGGPIIKNKLFFFVNAEYQKDSDAGVSWVPSTDGVANDAKGISRTTETDLKRVSDYLKSTYNYDPGKYKDWDPFKKKNYKVMARIDWNINNNNKFMIRYNDVKYSTMNVPNANSVGADRSLRPSSARMSASSIAFQNNFYGMENTVRSLSAELNSILNDKISNSFRATYTSIKDHRTSNSDIFPHVDIWKDGDIYMSFGYELFSFNNEVINDTWNITDNMTFHLNNHTVTVGASYEHLYVKNSYIREGTSFYRYKSVDDFLNNATPTGFCLTYGYNGEEAPGQELTFGYAGAYAQDEWQITPKFKLTYGIRFEMPFYLDDMLTNNAIKTKTANFEGGAWDVGTWPKKKISINPRAGFNWDVNGDRSLQVRGGTGLFSGYLPFVWFTNQVGNSAMVQSPELTWNAATCASYGLKFNPDYKKLIKGDPTTFPQSPDANYLQKFASIALVDKDFKFPQIWRSNLAIDVQLPWNMVFTAEALYAKDINAIYFKNSNEAKPSGKMAGSDKRDVWTDKKIEPSLTSAILVSNTRKGYQAQFSAQLTKNYSNGWSGMMAYTYSIAKDVSQNAGSSASSAWSANSNVNSLSSPVLGYSNFSIPHRLIANVSRKVSMFGHMATTLSLLYEGSSMGRYSYVYSGDLNGDGNKGCDLMYIPKNASDITFVPYKGMTPEEQGRAFMEYVEGNKYLKSKKGDYVDRFGYVRPWVHRFDAKVIQDLFTNFGTDRRYTLQISLDILNVGNLLNNKWGAYSVPSFTSYQNVMPLTVIGSGTATTAPTFALNATSVDDFKKKAEPVKAVSIGNVWSMLLGLRFIF